MATELWRWQVRVKHMFISTYIVDSKYPRSAGQGQPACSNLNGIEWWRAVSNSLLARKKRPSIPALDVLKIGQVGST